MILTEAILVFAAGFLTAIVVIVLLALLLVRSLVKKLLTGAAGGGQMHVMKIRRNSDETDNNQ